MTQLGIDPATFRLVPRAPLMDSTVLIDTIVLTDIILLMDSTVLLTSEIYVTFFFKCDLVVEGGDASFNLCVTSCRGHATSCYIMLHHATSCYILLHHAESHQITMTYLNHEHWPEGLQL